MSFLVSSDPLISGAFAVRAYAGFGILGADIPEDGDNGASPVLNDIGVVADGEYYWYAETLPTDGTLTLYPDLTFLFEDAADGTYTWTYRVGDQTGVSSSVGTVTIAVGATDGAAAGAISTIVIMPPAASAIGTSVGSGSATGALPVVTILGFSATGIGTLAGDGSSVGALATVSLLAPVASALGTSFQGAALGSLPSVFVGSFSATGGLPAFTRAPSGSGYRRTQEITTRPKQKNTTRH